MTFRIQALLFCVVVIGSIAVSRLLMPRAAPEVPASGLNARAAETSASPSAAYKEAAMTGSVGGEAANPERRWDVLDPVIAAQAVTVQSIDSHFSFLNYHTYALWPMASLTKLLTATVALENLGLDAKVSVSEHAVQTEGASGGLVAGEKYATRDLVKLMLLSSSNDAAAAFEEYAFASDTFVGLMTKKIAEIGMTQTVVNDASGLSDYNVSSASDLLKLARYIAERHPEIFEWTRLQTFIAQPLGAATSNNIANINPFSADRDFLGGKTGTSPAAGENLLALFRAGDRRIAVVVLGAKDRVALTNSLRNWIEKAYTFNR
jgi:D-alanyl-D-alanine carboxypeptidase